MTGYANAEDRWVARLAREGYATIPDLLAPAEAAMLAAELDAIFAREDGIAVERGWATRTYRVAYMLPAKSRIFLELCRHPRLLSLARSILGASCRLGAMNGYTTTPGGEAQRLHTDQSPPFSSETLYLNVVCALDPFTVENGATRIVPGSHRPRASAPDASAMARAAVSIEVPAGGGVAYPGTTWHGSGANRTARPRRSLHVFFRRPWAESHWDFAASLDAETQGKLPPDLKEILAIGSGPRRYDLRTDTIRR